MNVHNAVLQDDRCRDVSTVQLATGRTGHLIQRVTAFFAERRNRRLNREALRSLAAKDDALLKDIGLSRGDIQWASTLPLSADATTELEIIARRKPRNSSH